LSNIFAANAYLYLFNHTNNAYLFIF
jgi:hypothetical protein